MTMAITFGLDISHHQDLALDLAQCRRDGIQFVFIKASEGSTFRDPEFGANLAEARAAGLLVAAYHYQRPATVADQLANITRTVPRDVPVILDVESGSGDVALTRMLVTALQAHGYTVPLLYLPRWYWQQLGRPSLAGLPPLWSSRYPDTVVGSLAEEWADVPAHYWDGYGGLPVAVLQFTSSARIAGHAPLDANAFRGTREELAALLGGEEDTVSAAEVWGYPISFQPPGADAPVTFSAAQYLVWGNYYASLTEKLLAIIADNEANDLTLDQLRQLHTEQMAQLNEWLKTATIDVDVTVGGRAVDDPAEGSTT